MGGDRIRPKSQELTRAELEVMQILWDKGRCLVHDVLAERNAPVPCESLRPSEIAEVFSVTCDFRSLN